MSEIEVGEYVRTYEGFIGILKQINKENYNYLTIDVQNEVRRDGYHPLNYLYLKNEDIRKYSKNIIDLIEVGDYVNGYPVRKIPNFNNELCNFDLNKMEWIPLKNIDVYYNILTKEQYESNCYTVERKK